MIDNFAYPELIRFFEDISAIPRASYNESQIADYLCNFARERSLEYYRDDANNVLINAPATKGRENTPPLLLQGHTDMVCEKNEGVEHDFSRDGLELYVDNGWLRARGSTLGADDGVAVAAMLCLLDGGVESHGALQCLFTAAEEVGLDGVKAFDYGKIYSRKMINMDSADESLIIAGCAGGQRSAVSFVCEAEERVAPYIARISVRGLCGGHSGEDIDKGRANANKLMGRILNSLLCDDALGIRILRIEGGTKDNAIPRECFAEVSVNDLGLLAARADELSSALRDGISTDDRNLSLTVEGIGENEAVRVMNAETAEKAVFLMNTVPNGVFEMNHEIEGIVEWSRNLGIVSLGAEGGDVVFSSRSSFASRIDASASELDAYARMLGASARHYNRYPGWNFAKESEIRDAYVKAYEEIFDRLPEITVIHAGLECGYISEAIEGMDVISCGPIVQNLHSPEERLLLSSFENFYRVVKKVVEDLCSTTRKK